MNADLYALIRQHGYPPPPRDVYAALGMTKREYYAALRWLEAYRFLKRPASTDRSWRLARVNVRLCACGAELTVANATCEVNRKGYCIVRRECRTCIRQRQVAKHREWSARNPGYYTRVNRRARQQRTTA